MTYPPRKLIYWVSAALGIAALAFVSLILIAPTLVNLESVKTEIESVTSREVGGTMTTDKISLSFLPRPHIVLTEPRISIPGAVEGQLRSLDVKIRLLPLFKRRIQVSSIELHEPLFTFIIKPHRGSSEVKRTKQWAERDIAKLLSSFTAKTAGLKTSIDSGRIVIRGDEREIMVIRDIELSVLVPTDQPAPKPAEEGAGTPLPQFLIIGRIDGIVIESPDLPGPVPVRIDEFEAGPELFTFRRLSLKMLDGSAAATGSFPRYLQGIKRVELSADAKIGARIEEWIRTRTGAASHPALRTPIQARNVRLLIVREREASLSADLQFGGGPKIDFSLGLRRDEVLLRKCRISDAESQADIALRITDQEIEASYEGVLTDATFGRLFNEERPGTRRISGSIRGKGTRTAPYLTTLNGVLDGENLIIPVRDQRLEISKVELRAEGSSLRIPSASLIWNNVSFDVKGLVTIHPGYLDADLDVSAGSIDAVKLRESIAPSPEKGEQKNAPAENRRSSPFPIRGNIRVSADSLLLGTFLLKPVHAAVMIQPGSVRLDPAQATVCGINLSGSMEFRKNQVSLDVRAEAKDQPLEETLGCFQRTDHLITGMFALSASLAGSGANEDIGRMLAGPVEFNARSGTINRMFSIAQMLELINQTEVFRGKYPGLGREGLRYNSIVLKGELGDGVLLVREGMMDAATMELAATGKLDLISGDLDFRVAVAPLKTVDAVVKRLPVLKNILQGTLIAIPFRVTGSLSKPDVKPISLADAGHGVSGVFSRTFKAPFKLVEGLVPQESKPH